MAKLVGGGTLYYPSPHPGESFAVFAMRAIAERLPDDSDLTALATRYALAMHGSAAAQSLAGEARRDAQFRRFVQGIEGVADGER